MGRHPVVSLGTVSFLAGATFTMSVGVTTFTAFGGAQYETAPEDHRDDEHNARDRGDKSGEPKEPPTASMRFCPNARPIAPAVRRPRLSRSDAQALLQS